MLVFLISGADYLLDGIEHRAIPATMAASSDWRASKVQSLAHKAKSRVSVEHVGSMQESNKMYSRVVLRSHLSLRWVRPWPFLSCRGSLRVIARRLYRQISQTSLGALLSISGYRT